MDAESVLPMKTANHTVYADGNDNFGLIMIIKLMTNMSMLI